MSDTPGSIPNDFVWTTSCHSTTALREDQTQASDIEFTVSKPLLCKKSSYFAAMFEGEFIEGQTQTVNMEEIEGVVSPQTMPALLQWMYNRQFEFNTVEPEEQITAAIELSRLADMCDVQDLGEEMAKFIKEVLIENQDPYPDDNDYQDRNTYATTDEHINSAGYFPRHHAVRGILAAASVEGFFKDKVYKFAKQARNHPTFGIDLLEHVRKALYTLKQGLGKQR